VGTVYEKESWLASLVEIPQGGVRKMLHDTVLAG
jgi:hypothetical protein